MKRIGAVLLLLVLTRCSDQPVQPKLPEQQTSPKAQLELQSDGLYCTPSGATLTSGALFQVCFNPGNWNRDLIVFIPGYHDPARDPSLPELPDNLSETSVSLLFTALGYGFATTSFRGTGLIQRDWISGDLLELVATAKALLTNTTGRTTRFVYQTGGSQGGLGTVQAVERYPNIFSGGLAGCGPIGDYRRQIAYVTDFRVVFDYFFAPVISDWPVWSQNVDDGHIAPTTWGMAEPAAGTALDDPTNADRISQVLRVTHAPTDPADPATIKGTTLGLLWYSFRGTNDAITKLAGMPYSNLDRQYTGSFDDLALNAGVARFHFTANPDSLATVQTSAHLRRPLVTIHTTGDPIVPIWHEPLYRSRLDFLGKLLETRITVDRYGHCNFTDAEVLAAFAVLVLKVTGANLLVSTSVLPRAEQQAEFLRLARGHGANPAFTH